MTKNIFKEIEKNSKYKLFIGGLWKSSKEYFEVRSPWDNSLVGYAPKARKEDATEAIKAALKARKALNGMSYKERVECFLRARELILENADYMIKILSKEAGKLEKDAKAEVLATANRLKMTERELEVFQPKIIEGDLANGSEGRKSYVYRAPLGIVMAITPFNYPLITPASKIIPALLSGNTVILKPASDTPLSGFLLGRILEKAGFPKGAVNVVTGSGREIGDYLVANKNVSMISFTGSTSVGKHISDICGMKKIHMELGGKGSAIVLADADLDLAAKEIASGALKYSGQRCDAVSRVFVEKKVAKDFKEKLLREFKKWRIKKEIGPIINEKSLENIQNLVDDAKKKGCRILTGGKRKDNFFEPTLIDKININMKIMWEETFGPVLPVMEVNNYHEAIKISNESEYGLDSSVYTKDIEKGIKISRLLEDGSTTINGHPSHGIGFFPFGGNKDSGIGREGIFYSIEEMTTLKNVVVNKT